MLNNLFRISDYLQYLITSSGRHGIHSPFVYQFNQEIIRGNAGSPGFEHIETIRRKMIKSDAQIDFVDYGTGKKNGWRALSELAANTAKNAKYSRLLYRLVKAVKPQYALELGTGTGITALYQALALNPETPLHTIEGSPKLSEVAQFNAEQCGLDQNIVFHAGTFESVLPDLLSNMPRVDYAYIDGNHSYQPTLHYFDMLMPKLHPNSVLVFDDINWSEEMKNAWAVIKNHKNVSVSIDIFALGIVFFRQGQEKEHFTIRF